jgi:hypothetical protein
MDRAVPDHHRLTRLVPLTLGVQRSQQREAWMVEHPDIHRPPDDQPDVGKFAALADASVTALGP